MNQSFITGAGRAPRSGVAVDGNVHLLGDEELERHDRPRESRRHGREQELHHGGRAPVGVAVSVVPVFVPIQIEIAPNPIALSSPLPIPVTVLGSSTVDVTKIDVTTLRFAPNGATPVSTEIVSADGQVDLVASFRVRDTGLAVGDTQACLQGEIGGQPFNGCGAVVVIFNPACGLGIELAPILPALLWLRGRRRRHARGTSA